MNKQGLTIVELLIAMVLLGLLATTLLAPLTGLFEMTGRSGQTLGTTAHAQAVMEHIQGQWRSYPRAQNPTSPSVQDARNMAAQQRSSARYAQTCTSDFPATPEGLKIEIQAWALDSDANQDAALTFSEACGGVSPAMSPPPMTRINVRVVSGETTTSLTADLARP